jgi:hypothetical protein
VSTKSSPLSLRRGVRREAAVLASLLLLPALAVGATPAATLPPPQHGGTVTEAAAHVFESLVASDGLHVWLYTDESAPAMVGRAGGTATLKLPDGATREVTLVVRAPQPDAPGVYFCPMHAEVVQKTPGKCEPCGGMVLFQQDELFGASDLKGFDPAKVAAQVHLTGLKGQPKEATFSPAFPRPAGKAAKDAKGK